MIGGSSDQYGSQRRAVVKLASYPRPVPLRSLGDGAIRLFGTLLALASASGGLLLIDEAENGIHHGAFRDYWSTIMSAAVANDVQVVATTHSWDCVKGFCEASTSDGMAALVRLEQSENGVRSVAYSPGEMEAIAEQGIEVR